MLMEVDTRAIPATNAIAQLFYDTELPDFYLVFIKDEHGNNITSLGAKDRQAALSAYRHPFSYKFVPDIFSDNKDAI